MLRLITYLAVIIKLLLLGRWYPPAHVRDVSTIQYQELADLVADMESRLREAERQIEATRKKVYREEVKIRDNHEAEAILTQKPEPEQRLAMLQAGDDVPDGLL
jgi:hypothetical protein